MTAERHLYRDTRQIIGESVEILAGLRGKWTGDDLATIELLVSLMDEAEQQLVDRVAAARGRDHSWPAIADVLGTSATEVRMRFDGWSPAACRRLHRL